MKSHSRGRVRKTKTRLGTTLLELMVAIGLTGATMLVLATLMTWTTSENAKTRGQMDLLSEFTVGFEVLNQFLAQTTQVIDCFCNPNCLMCTTAAGCAEFPQPNTLNPPNPPALGACTDDPSGAVEGQLGLAANTLDNTCLMHMEFEDLRGFPKRPTAALIANPAGFGVAVPEPANEPWKALPDAPFLQGVGPNDSADPNGSCNDFARTAPNAERVYAAGCWKDLYVYYVRATPGDPASSVESTPGYLIFAVTTTPARNGNVNPAPLQTYTIGTFPGSGSAGSGRALQDAGVVGVACGYLPASRDPAWNTSVDGNADANRPGIVAAPATYANVGAAFPRSLEFGMYVQVKTRRNNLRSNPANAGNYESWDSAGANFAVGQFRHLYNRNNLQNLSERGLHFLKMSATRTKLRGVALDGHNRPTGCVANGFNPVTGRREECCSGAINAGTCIACEPSGVLATGVSTCCSEQVPDANGNCP